MQPCQDLIIVYSAKLPAQCIISFSMYSGWWTALVQQ